MIATGHQTKASMHKGSEMKTYSMFIDIKREDQCCKEFVRVEAKDREQALSRTWSYIERVWSLRTSATVTEMADVAIINLHDEYWS
jgi:hypothetical protein